MTILKSFLITIAIIIVSTAIGFAMFFLYTKGWLYTQMFYLSEILPNLIVYGFVLIYLRASNEKIKMNYVLNNNFFLSIVTLAFGIHIVDLPFFYWKNISNIYFKSTYPLTDYTNYRFENSQLYKIFSVLIIAPFFEEITFRFYFFGGLLKSYNFITAILTSSILFSISHIASPRNLLPSFYFGLIASFIYYKTKNISYCIVFHLTYNFLWTLTFIFAKEYNNVIDKIGFGFPFLLIYIFAVLLCILGIKQISGFRPNSIS